MPKVGRLFEQRMFYAQSYEDFLLYRAASRSLYLAIESLGGTSFDDALKADKDMMEDAKEWEPEAIFRCVSNGVKQEETKC
mmetsp:Transcript_29556/g.43590  ORF Transcript_29556/g.43590 Transcript_29556/m.43590 type:complete len:81 (+) Transcript_29556:517-759(+)